MELLLNRPVWTHEFGLNRDGLIEDAEKAFALIQQGKEPDIPIGYVAQKTVESIELLYNHADKNNKKVIGMVM